MHAALTFALPQWLKVVSVCVCVTWLRCWCGLATAGFQYFNMSSREPALLTLFTTSLESENTNSHWLSVRFKSDSQFFFQSSWLLECYAKTKGMFMSEQIIISFFSQRKKTPLLVRVNKTDLSVCFSLLVPFRSFWLNYLTNNVICCTVHFTNTTSSD